MPIASVWMIRAALLHLATSSLIGGWLLLAKDGGSRPPGGSLPLHAGMALLGWLVQMTMGVGYWMLPKHATGAARGAAWLPWVTFGCLNIGIFLAAVEPWLAGTGPAGLILVGAGIVVFLTAILPRVKAFGVGR